MSEILDVSFSQRTVSTAQYDVVVVGAGPYGLTTAAHLLKSDLKVAIFGVPLQLWRENMPKGMLLRSYWWATTFSDPAKKYGLAQYLMEKNEAAVDPLPAETVINYGLWFQKNLVPNVDETYVKTIERKDGQFLLTLADGRLIQSSMVVMAPGLRYYAYRPSEYNHLHPDLVTHTSDHHTFDKFAGKSVVIIGGGQGALETSALAHESGVHVHLVSRKAVVWITGSAAFPENRSLPERIIHPKAGIAPGYFNWALEQFPYLFQQLPRAAKNRLLKGIGSYGPMGSSWLKPRVVDKVQVHEMQYVQNMKEADDGIEVSLSNNKTLKADHVILGTGYRADLKRLSMLHPSLQSEIQTYFSAPILNNHFETSVPGLYFVGFSSVSSCGPLFRFVVGTDAASRQVASSIEQHLIRARKMSYA